MGRRWINLIFMGILCFSLISSSEILLVKSESNSLVTINDEQFIIQQILGGFSNYFVGSFNAKNGYWIELDISSSSNDAYKVYLDIISANHGIIFSGKGKEFSQTVYLDYEDVYNITIAKAAFYSTVMINGTIGVFHNETATQSSSENWVEVTRFSGDRIGISRTESFSCEHDEWRIRWEYVPNVDSNWSVLNIYVNDLNKRIDSVVNTDSEITNGILYINDNYGTYYLDLISNVPSYLIIVEQNLESIPEFPSGFIFVFILIASLTIVLTKKAWRQVT